jgi:hypothetical protein
MEVADLKASFQCDFCKKWVKDLPYHLDKGKPIPYTNAFKPVSIHCDGKYIENFDACRVDYVCVSCYEKITAAIGAVKREVMR